MNKYQQLTKSTITIAVKAAVALVISGGIFAAAAFYEGSVLTKKNEAEAKLKQDDGLLSNLRSQMDQSGEAENKFSALRGGREAADFSASFEDLQNFLRITKDRYRISADLKITKDEPTDKAELKNFPYDVLLRRNLELKVQAISDAHIFSFIHDLEQSAPGLIRIDKLEIKRAAPTADLTDQTINTLKTGATPLLVDATIVMTWIHFEPKKSANTNAAGGTPPAGVP